MNKLEKLKPEAAQEVHGEVQSDDDDGALPIAPVPADAQPPNFFHSKFGHATATWAYYDEQGRLVGYTMRFDYIDENGDPARAYRPLAWCITPTGPEWRKRAFPTPRPLYRLPEILERPDATVLICEGERTADAAQLLLPDMVATTSAFGAQKAEKTNWSALVGRSVIIAPDHDEHGEAFCEAVTDQLFAAGVTDVRILQSEQLGRTIWFEGQRLARDKVPKGWDLADARDEGWTADTLAHAIAQPGVLRPAPRPLLLDNNGRCELRLTEHGIEARVPVKEKGKIVWHRWKWICDPLELVALTRDETGSQWGRLFKFTNPDGRAIEIVIPDEWLAGDGTPCREKLQSQGLTIGTSKPERELLHKYMSKVASPARATVVDRMGWHGTRYVAGEDVVGKSDAHDRIVFTGGDQSRVGYTSGTLEGWQEEVARYAEDNSRLVLVLCAAFASMLLEPTGTEPGGIHFVGNSSIGKSTLLIVAGSVFGGGGAGGYVRSWCATANALEGVAAAHCDALLCLDEIGQATGKDVSKSAYMLANGIGKLRSSKTLDIRPPKVWRTIVLSTGEITLSDKIAEDGRSARAAAGQLVRSIDMPAAAPHASTIIENLHGFATPGELIRHLRWSASTHYGHAWKPLAEHVASNRDAVVDEVRSISAEFVSGVLPSRDVDGQVVRVAQKLSLYAATGEVAIRLGILPWRPNEAIKGVRVCFKEWFDLRGGADPLEEQTAVEQVRHFLEKYGESRFVRVFDSGTTDEQKLLRDRAGFRNLDKEGNDVFHIFPQVWRNEVCKGLDHIQVARILAKKGMLNAGTQRLQRQKKVEGSSSPRWFFEVNAKIFEHGPRNEIEAALYGKEST